MSTWQGYITEARRFWEVAQALDLPGYPNQAVSNAVYAVIAATDALGVWRTGQFAGDHSHAEVLALLGRACTGTTLEAALPERTDQLRCVLRHDRSAHPGETVDEGSAREAMREAAEYIGWVEQVMAVETE